LSTVPYLHGDWGACWEWMLSSHQAKPALLTVSTANWGAPAILPPQTVRAHIGRIDFLKHTVTLVPELEGDSLEPPQEG